MIEQRMRTLLSITIHHKMNVWSLLSILVLFPISIIHANDPLSSYGRDSLRFAPVLQTSCHIPIGRAAESWCQYMTIGGGMFVPTVFRNVDCFTRAETGLLNDRGNTRYIQVLHLSVGFVWKRLVSFKCFDICPALDLTNMMIGNREGRLAPGNHLFSDVENEYGINVTVIYRIITKRLTLMLPFQVGRVFSSPHHFSSVAVSLAAGYQFDL
jgi:hypothetical protein